MKTGMLISLAPVLAAAMTAIVNGMAAYGGLKPFGATFFVFSDYCKPALRLAALMGLPSIFVFSHDSFYVGEDGPTHEPIEQIESLRTMPNLDVYRPADANETGACLALMLMRDDGPSNRLRQAQHGGQLPHEESGHGFGGCSRGGCRKGVSCQPRDERRRAVHEGRKVVHAGLRHFQQDRRHQQGGHRVSPRGG